MITVQANVRVPPGDKPFIRAVAARLRAEPRFRDRLQALLAEAAGPALQQRIERLEGQVDWLRAAIDQARAPLRLPHAGTRLRTDMPHGSAA